ncbi:putative transcriptional regulator [Bacillus thuringiensis HD-771]|uniref:Transcriptional regulator n=1 Tax=Bacillus thuringiensis HD-771 TaxID=1218175 RepID=A0A9W3NYB6_BACTU|nr:putative transcriptional regulator [Bacillus thuringiensis HD-771]
MIWYILVKIISRVVKDLVNIQFKKGVLELIALALLTESDQYGYSLIKHISKKIEISEGSLYPLLRKLVNDDCLSTYFQESREGPARKYYSITKKGEKKLRCLLNEWIEFSDAINHFIKESDFNEQK